VSVPFLHVARLSVWAVSCCMDSSAAPGQLQRRRAAGRDEPPAAAAKDQGEPEPFAKVHAQWQAVAKQMDAISEKFQSVPPGERDGLRQEFMTLLARAKQIVPRLRRSALASFLAKPTTIPKSSACWSVSWPTMCERRQSSGPRTRPNLIEIRPTRTHLEPGGVAAFASDDFDSLKVLKAAKTKEALDRRKKRS